MGVPFDGPSWLFGDNHLVITSSTIPSSMLSKQHNALAYHHVREAVAGKIIKFCFIIDWFSKKQGTSKNYLPYL